ncbi:Octopamine receptor [Schistosoma japonicum]|nr:Octopamine receptor [Schistosoma japonicum]
MYQPLTLAVDSENEYIQQFCCISIASETVVCHAILLHLLGSSLDTHFRLTKPKWFSNVTNASNKKHLLAIRLKIAAPWIVSILQTGAQIMLSDPFPPAYLEEGRFCTTPDVNFLILRTLVAFLLPLLTSVIIIFMTAHRIQTLQCQKKQHHSKISTLNVQQKKMDNVINPKASQQPKYRFITSCINNNGKTCEHKVEQKFNFDSRSENFQPECETFHENENNRLNKSRYSSIETNLNTNNDIHNLQKITNKIINNRNLIGKYSKSSSHKHLHSPVLLHIPPVSYVSTTTTTAFIASQYQQGSSSSDAGISSQTTGDTDEFLQHSCFTSKLSNYDTISNHSPITITNNHVDSNDESDYPWKLLTNDQQTTKVSDNNCQKIIKHFCPQHGQVIIPEHFFKSLLSVVEEVDLGQYGSQRTNDLILQNNEIIPQSEQNKNIMVEGRNSTLSLTTNIPYTGYIIDNKLNGFDKDDDLMTEIYKQNNILSQLQSYDQERQCQKRESLNSWSRETFKHFAEQKAVKLNMILCAITIAMWSPFITASLSHLLLSNSNYFHLLSIGTLIQFKWLAYMSSVVYPVGFLLVDSQLCKATFSQMCCRKR